MKTIAIANQKGGTGKTTTAYNLGIALTQQGYRVLMVDFDPQGNLSCYCGIPPEQDLEQTITELLMKVAYEKPLSHRECVYQSKRTDDSAPQVDFIPSNLRLASFELAMGTMMCREVLLKTCLEQYSSQYDYCIIDCSPSVGLLLTNALSAANEVIIPMQAQPFSVVGMSQLTNSISSVQRKINPGLHIRGVLLTMTQHTKVSEHYAHDVRAKYGRTLHVFTTEIPYNVKVQESQAFAAPTLYAQDTYASLEDMNRMALANLDFDSLMEVDINEIEEQEPEISADEPEESTFVSQVMQDVDRLAAREEPAEYDRTNYLAPYEPAVPEGPKAKFAVNVQAIRTLKEIEQRMASGGAPATEQEQDILAGYLGWGGLADAFDPGKDNWQTEYEQLKTLLTEDEYAAARESTLTAFYTPPAVIHAMYHALEHIGCVGGNVLEPSMGVGAFFGHRHSKFDTHNAKLYGVELDSLSGRIAQQLYQKAKIQITGYEKADLPDNFFDLAIGNVPFGQYQVSDRRYDKLHFQIHDYFLAKTVDKLRVGGIMAFITTSGTLDKKSEEVRKYLAARCDLIGAVRLPNTTFKSNAGTEVTSDILFLQKRGRVLEQDAPWIHVGETENGTPLNQYFIDHPEMVCGEMQMVSGPYGMRSTCVPNEQSPLAEQLDAALSTLHAEYTLVDEQEYAEEESGTIDADPNVRNFSYTVKDAHLVGEATHTTELGNDAAGNMIRFQNVVSALPQDLNRLHGSLEQLTKQLTNAEEELKQPFLQEQELSDKSARLAELDALLNVGNDAPIIEGEAEELEEEPEDALIQSGDELER